MQKHVSCFIAFVSFLSFLPVAYAECTTTELHRVLIENSTGGSIKGSRDGGKSWVQLGNVTTPMNGDYWIPSQTGGVLAFDFLRGPSSVFASAVNNLHFRFSDPEGYTLPEDVTVRPIRGHGISVVPSNNRLPYAGASYAALTNIPGGTLIFGKEWSPRIGDRVFVDKNDGTGFAPIPYEFKMLPSMSLMSRWCTDLYKDAILELDCAIHPVLFLR